MADRSSPEKRSRDTSKGDNIIETEPSLKKPCTSMTKLVPDDMLTARQDTVECKEDRDIENIQRLTKHVDKVKPAERKQFANEVVDTAIYMYGYGQFAQLGSCLMQKIPFLSASFKEKCEALPWNERHEKIARLLYEAGQRLGGIPIKAMQFVSQRDDAQKPYIKWFSKAQEDFDVSSRPEYVQELLAPIRDLRYEARPAKSASMGQVHFGHFKQKPCVVKVQHEHVREVYEADLEVMAELGRKVNKYPEARGAGVMLSSLAEKLRETCLNEIDFKKESLSQERVFKNFEKPILVDNQERTIAVAEIYHANEKVLVMERLKGMTIAEHMIKWKQGIKLDELARLDRDTIYTAYATMVFAHRFVQTDAHPGNIMKLDDGRIAILDFGQALEISDTLFKKLQAFFLKIPDVVGLKDPNKVQPWLECLGITVSKENAIDVAQLLFFGCKSSLFPDMKEMKPECAPILLMILSLSRLENTIAEGRRELGLQDEVNSMAVLNAFAQAAVG